VHPTKALVSSLFQTTQKGQKMKLSSLVTQIAATLLTSVAPIVVQANELSQRSDLAAARHDNLLQNRWLNQFGAKAHVVPLCNDGLGSASQLLSLSTCATLASIPSQVAKPAVMSLRISQIKRNRTAWNAIAYRALCDDCFHHRVGKGM
jgi:hypothetical protein